MFQACGHQAILHCFLSYAIMKHDGLFWELNPGPLAPSARIIPLDQTADVAHSQMMNHAASSKVAMSFAFIKPLHLGEPLNQHWWLLWIALLRKKLPSCPQGGISQSINCMYAAVCGLCWMFGSVLTMVRISFASMWGSGDGFNAWQTYAIIRNQMGCSGNWTQDLSHPNRESYH